MSVIVEYHENWASIELNRPERANSYNQAMLSAFLNAIEDIIQKKKRGVVVSAVGNGAFCSGADLDEMAKASPESAKNLLSQAVFDRLATSDLVSIAAIQGPAVAGGFELALSCDLRVASPKAWFSLPEVSLGLIPAAGGCTRLTALFGAAIAKHIIIGGQKVDSQQALDWGIVNIIDVNPKQRATNWMQNIMGHDPLALTFAKQAINEPSLKQERLFAEKLYAQKITKSR